MISKLNKTKIVILTKTPHTGERDALTHHRLLLSSFPPFCSPAGWISGCALQPSVLDSAAFLCPHRASFLHLLLDRYLSVRAVAAAPPPCLSPCSDPHGNCGGGGSCWALCVAWRGGALCEEEGWALAQGSHTQTGSLLAVEGCTARAVVVRLSSCYDNLFPPSSPPPPPPPCMMAPPRGRVPEGVCGPLLCWRLGPERVCETVVPLWCGCCWVCGRMTDSCKDE